jgi:ATP-dependent exoDNAse (exonuclease V) beta subunit
MPLADQAARDRIATDLETTLVVEAAAGTGKTTELVRRMVALLASGRAQLDQIVALTFTDAAAGELKLRLRTEIELRRTSPTASPAERDRLTGALPHLEQARVGTIHSFCADLLRERPFRAGIDPLFEVTPDEVARDLFGGAFDRWLERQLALPTEAVRRVLRRSGDREGGPRTALRAAAWALAERRDTAAPWRRISFARDPEIDALVDEIRALGDFAERGDPDDYFVRSLAELQGFAADVDRTEAVRGRDHDALEVELARLLRSRSWGWRGWDRRAQDFPKAELTARRDELRARLERFVRDSGADLAPRLQEELQPVLEAYESLKERAGCLDFLDLLLRARSLMLDVRVRSELQERFTHLFVDEFQDTDPIQLELLLLLAADDPAETDWRRVRPRPGKLFLVGDPKQSIYRFRRADVALYETVKRQLQDAGAALVHLTTSFRTVPEIQAVVNTAFAPRMTGGSPSQASYVPLEPFREARPEQPAVVALPVPRPYGDYGKIVKWKIDESLPEAVGAFVEWLVHSSGWRVTEREGSPEGTRLEPRHVCLLFRRFRSFGEDLARPYVRALEARGLPHLLVGGSSFHRREEIEAIRNALSAIERPEDELAVFATLRGPFFALTDAALLTFHETVGALHPLRPVPADATEAVREVGDALAVLRDLHLGRHRRPIADTIGRLLAATRAHAALAIWPTGEQALANVARLLDLARRAERRGTGSFRSFVEHLREEAESGEAGEAPLFEEGAEGVRIMTVHRAKGLEFPVVILTDITAGETPRYPQRWVDADRGLCAMRLAGAAPIDLLEHEEEEREREREEADRVLYVAATRARDLLVVPAVGDEPLADSWVGALDPAIRPVAGRGSRPERRSFGGVHVFGAATVLDRPAKARPRDPITPGFHRTAAGGPAVLWWAPAALRLDVEPSVGLRQQKLLTADEGEVRSEQGIQAHERWREERASVRARASEPSTRVLSPSDAEATAAAVDDAAAAAVALERVEALAERPHGQRFGALVHAVLAAVDFAAASDAIERVTELHARLLGAPADEIRAAASLVERALAHPLLRRAANAAARGDLRRETAISLALDDGRVVEGVIDAAFVEADREAGWTVVDFKTDLELGVRRAEYRRQVALYCRAIEHATGLPARGVVLQI